jgi:hypothetical protein
MACVVTILPLYISLIERFDCLSTILLDLLLSLIDVVGYLLATLLDFVPGNTERFDCSLTSVLDLGLDQFGFKCSASLLVMLGQGIIGIGRIVVPNNVDGET